MIFLYFMNLLLMLVMILLSVAFLTLLERKILSYIQMRKGPNKLGFKGILQPFSDALKLMSKEWFFMNMNYMIYMLSPAFLFIISLFLWYFYPWMGLIYLEYSFILLMLIMGINIYPILMIGWSSSSNYSMLGSLRSVAQMISFEISLFLMVFILLLLIESYSIYEIVNYQINIKFSILLFPLYLMFLMSLLIELNRVPFDLIEGESELVSGFNVEYYSSMFTLIFLAEYANILFMSMLLTMLFFGFEFWSILFVLMYIIHILFFLWIRGVLPRIRYDELMYMCWTDLLLIMLFYVLYIYLVKEFIYI